MRAEVAFGGSSRIRIDVDSIVGAGLKAGLAANADIWIKFDDAIVPLIHCRYGADSDTGWICAVITARHLKMSGDVGVRSGLDVFDPRTIHAEWHFILALAGRRTSMTSDAPIVSYQEAVIHARTLLG